MTTATTSPPVTCVCSDILLITMIVALAQGSGGLTILGQHDVVPAATVGFQGYSEGFCWPQYFATAKQPQSQMPFQAYANYAIGPSQGISLSGLSIPPISSIICLYVWWCLLSAVRFLCGCHFYQWGLNHWGLWHCNPLEYTFGRYMCFLMLVCGPHQECTEWLLLQHLQLGGSFMLLI